MIRELMRAGGYKTLTVSENSLLAGMAATINETLDGTTPPSAGPPASTPFNHPLISCGEIRTKIALSGPKQSLFHPQLTICIGIQKKRARIPRGHGPVTNTW